MSTERVKDTWDHDSEVFCFPSPLRDAPMTQPFADARFAQGLSARLAEGLSGLVPVLLCGEESAVCVFERECRTEVLARDVLQRIATEEETHRRLLLRLQAELPTSPDLPSLRKRAAGLYFRLGAETHTGVFSKIVELDSCVCILLGDLLQSSEIPADARDARELLAMIRRDESGHVRACRKYLAMTGGGDPELAESARRSMLKMLSYVGDALELLGTDTDRLIDRIRKRGAR